MILNILRAMKIYQHFLQIILLGNTYVLNTSAYYAIAIQCKESTDKKMFCIVLGYGNISTVIEY